MISCLAVLARKSVKQRFSPDEHIAQLMEAFRRMTNDCIRIGLAERKTSLKSLSLACYPKLTSYQVPSAYRLAAISRATGILRIYRNLSKKHHVKEPFCTRPSLTTCYGVNVHAGKLRIPGNTEILLNTYVQRFLSQPGLEVRSVTLTPDSVNVSVRKLVEPAECIGLLGMDRNLRNVTLADTEGNIEVYDLSKVTDIKSRCRLAKQRFRRNDVRVRKRIFRKYGQLERDRVCWLFHNISANIVLQAKLRRQAIAMEDLKGIRKLYRKGNGQGTDYRSTMNSWSYAELQRQIEYKAEWNGIPVIYVKSYGTSASCSMCGHRMLPEESRRLHCPNCGLTLDRDVNAARNILARGLRFKPVWSASEVMVQEPTRSEVILKVDADQSTWKATDEPAS
jgi:putative transposase